MMYERMFWALLLAFCVWFAFRREWMYETEISRYGVVLKKRPGRETVVWISPLLLPCFFAVVFVVLALAQGARFAAEYTLHLFLSLGLQFSLYYLLLLIFLPLLRRFFSARACATLWVLPVFLYCFPYIIWGAKTYRPPLWVVRVPPAALRVFCIVWAIGFAAVLVWRVAAHVVFRRRVLQNARDVTDPGILKIWADEQALTERKSPVPLLYSPAIQAPLTIGAARSSLRTLLPDRPYTEGELRLIFRHELRHIQRRDIDTKIFFAFCEAFCWFNPLMWAAVRNASSDLELSCDEMVVYGADQDGRKQYAALLLSEAGASQGFTTCLSSSARSLRRRLKNIVHPHKRLPGSLLLAAVMAALVFGTGFVTVSGTYGTLGELVLSGFESLEIQTVTAAEAGSPYSDRYTSVYGWDEAGLTAWVSGLSVTQIDMGGDAPDDSGRGLYLCFQTETGLLWVDVTERYAKVRNSVLGSRLYRLDAATDWDAAERLLDFDAPNPDPAPQPPRLMLWFSAEGKSVTDGVPMSADAHRLRITDADGVLEPEPSPITWSGIEAHVTQVRLEFTYPPADGYTVSVEGLDGQPVYEVNGDELNSGVLPLAPYSACYTVRGQFESRRNTTYDMVFYFKVVLPET